METNSQERQFTTRYKTYIFELWIIFAKMGETEERQMTAPEIGSVWNDAKFGNLGRVIFTLIGYPFTIVSYIMMKRAQSRALRGQG